MKILLIGKTGQLGSSIISVNTKHQIIAPTRSEFDIEKVESFEGYLDRIMPDVVINTAAFHNVPLCEIQPHKAFDINVVKVKELALACKKVNTLFITFSTDYVFGGEKKQPYIEDDYPQPIQMYGITRLAGEMAVQAVAASNSIIIRTSGLYGLKGATSKGGNFVDKRIVDARNSSKIEMGCDQVVSPTYTHDLAVAILKLIEQPKCVGVYHLVNEGQCTWYEFTKAIYEQLKINVKVIPIDRGGLSGEMRRPLYSKLGNTRAKRLGIQLPDWQDALNRYLNEKYMSS